MIDVNVNGDTEALLSERGKTHGDFGDHARITSRLKDVMAEEIALRTNRGQPPLTFAMRESLDMIAHKIGRIIAGHAGFTDHWDDIAGYARLVAGRCAPAAVSPTTAPRHWAPPEKSVTNVSAVGSARCLRPIRVAWGADDPGDSAG